MKTVLIIGAGVTRAATSARSIRKQPPLDSDFFDIAKTISPRLTSNVLNVLQELVGEHAISVAKSLETTATYLYLKAIDSPNGSTYHMAFLDLLGLVNSVLEHTTNSIQLSPRSLLYRFFLCELERVNAPENLTVLTFNYDLLIERVLEQIALKGRPNVYAFPGCYRMSNITRTTGVTNLSSFSFRSFERAGVAVLKLHGSLNWQSRHTSNKPTTRSLFAPHREIHVINAPMIPRSLTWRRAKRTVYMKPVIIPPVSGKRGMMHSNIVPLWSEAGKALKGANRVVIAGYSCPPLDIESRILLSENLTANNKKRVYVIDPNTETAARFSELCSVDHVTIYDSISKWVTDSKKYP